MENVDESREFNYSIVHKKQLKIQERRMRVLLLTLMLSISGLVFSQSIEEARELYSKRGTDVTFAQQSADMFLVLSESTEDKLLKATYLNGASNSLYYVAAQSESNLDKKKIHTDGLNKASQAISLLLGTQVEAEKEQLAIAYYRYGANLGKWAEANGVAASLSKWPNLKNTMNSIISLGKKEIEWFGANRILGRAFYKLPFPLGSKKKAYNYLKEAFDATKNGNEVSVHGLNNLYLADLLIAVGKSSQAKKILETFVTMDPETLCPERVPETKEEIQMALKKLETL